MVAQFTKSHIITFKSAQLKFLQLKSKISVTSSTTYSNIFSIQTTLFLNVMFIFSVKRWKAEGEKGI